MKLSDHEQVVLKAIEHVAGSRNGLASVPAVTRAVNYPISTTQKILAALHRREIIALHHHDYPAQMTADEKKRAVKIGNDYFHAVAIRNPMKRGASKKNPSPAQLKARAAFTRMAKKRAAEAKKANPPGMGEKAGRAADAKVRKSINGYLAQGWDFQKIKDRVWLYYGYTLIALDAEKATFTSLFQKGGWILYLNPKRGGVSSVKTNPVKRKRAANPRYLVSATDARGNIADLGVLVSPNKTQAVARAKKLYKGYKKFTAAMVDKGDYIGPKGVVKIRRKRPTKKTNPTAAMQYFLDELNEMDWRKPRIGRINSLIDAALDAGISPAKLKLQIGKQIGKANAIKIVNSRIYARNPKKNGVVKTAGKAIKKVTRAVLGGVSKVAGKGAKALKNPALSEAALALIARLQIEKNIRLHSAGAPEYRLYEEYPRIFEAPRRVGRGSGYYLLRLRSGWKTAVKKAQENPRKKAGPKFYDVYQFRPEIGDWAKAGTYKAETAQGAIDKARESYRNYMGVELPEKFKLKAELKNPSRRRNLDHRDSSHQVKVHQHWRAGGLSQWQRAHHAGQHDLFSHRIKAKPKRNPSAKKIRKKFAGRVGPGRDLYFPKGAPQGLAKLGRLVSIKLKGGKLIKPSRRNPSAEIWLCSDTSGKLWLGCTKAGPLYAGAPGDLGEMSMLEYSESKPHIGYPAQTIWFHKMGEVSGRRPHLIVNDDQDLLIKGGNYKITRAGIVD